MNVELALKRLTARPAANRSRTNNVFRDRDSMMAALFSLCICAPGCWAGLAWHTLRFPAQVALVAYFAAGISLVTVIEVRQSWKRFRAFAERKRGDLGRRVALLVGHRPNFPDRDFDVGPDGFTGHFDKMLGLFRGGTVAALFVMEVWIWVFRWPHNTAIWDISPSLSVADLLVVALIACTIIAFAPLLVGVYWGLRWIALERRGLFTIVKNDHVFRISSYRSGRSSIYDERTQNERLNDEIAGNHRRRGKLQKEAWKLFAWIIASAIAFIAFERLPLMLGPRFLAFTQHINIDALANWSRDQAPGFAAWLTRPDVHGILASITFEGLVLGYLFFFGIVRAASDLFWTAFDGFIHWNGFQYVPAAQVLEGRIHEKTIDHVREEAIHGDIEFQDPLDGARQLAR